jgi:mono/diheme cytochrome c family protein
LKRLLCALLWATAAAAAPIDPAPPDVGAAIGSAGGEQIYTRVCQGCHMPDGRGAIGAGRYPALAGDAALMSWEEAAVIILNGRNAMPAFGVPDAPQIQIRVFHLSDANVADVVNYVRSHFGNHWKPTVTATKVAALPHPAQ